MASPGKGVLGKQPPFEHNLQRRGGGGEGSATTEFACRSGASSEGHQPEATANLVRCQGADPIGRCCHERGVRGGEGAGTPFTCSSLMVQSQWAKPHRPEGGGQWANHIGSPLRTGRGGNHQGRGEGTGGGGGEGSAATELACRSGASSEGHQPEATANLVRCQGADPIGRCCHERGVRGGDGAGTLFKCSSLMVQSQWAKPHRPEGGGQWANHIGSQLRTGRGGEQDTGALPELPTVSTQAHQAHSPRRNKAEAVPQCEMQAAVQ